MRKPTICICENKAADQLRSNCEADQRLCFRYTDSTLPLLLKSEISGFQPASVTDQPDLCWTCSETTLLVFSRSGSNIDARSLLTSPISILIQFYPNLANGFSQHYQLGESTFIFRGVRSDF